MVLCGVCKKKVEGDVKWLLRDISPSNSVISDIQICNSCAHDLVKGVMADLKLDPSESFHVTSLFGGIKFEEKGVLTIPLLINLDNARKRLLKSKKT